MSKTTITQFGHEGFTAGSLYNLIFPYKEFSGTSRVVLPFAEQIGSSALFELACLG